MKTEDKQNINYSLDITQRIRLPKVALDRKIRSRNKDRFSGIRFWDVDGACFRSSVMGGITHGMTMALNGNMHISCTWNGMSNGYLFSKHPDGYILMIEDMDVEIEILRWNKAGELISSESLEIESDDLDLDTLTSGYPSFMKHVEMVEKSGPGSSLMEVSYFGSGIEMKLAQKLTWAYIRNKQMKEGWYDNESDILPFYILQNELREKVIKKDILTKPVKLIAGVDVAYNEKEWRMVAAIVVFDYETFEIVEESTHEMDINFPYIPGLFSFREIPPIIEAYKKLVNKPDIIICDGHGIAHPKGVGMATHLGIELDIPTIGCGKSRLIGVWNKEDLDSERGSIQPLIWEEGIIGNVLRTQKDIKPVFVSIGHKVGLETATETTLKMCQKYRLPETTRRADHIVNTIMREKTEVDFLDKCKE